MLLWRLCRVFMRTREVTLGEGSSGNSSGKSELRALTLRISRVVGTMKRFGFKITPQSGAMLADVAQATNEFGLFRVLEQKLKDMEEDEPDFGL